MRLPVPRGVAELFAMLVYTPGGSITIGQMRHAAPAL